MWCHCHFSDSSFHYHTVRICEGEGEKKDDNISRFYSFLSLSRAIIGLHPQNSIQRNAGNSRSLHYSLLGCFVQYDRCLLREKQENGIHGDNNIPDIDGMLSILSITFLTRDRSNSEEVGMAKKDELALVVLAVGSR